MRGSCIRRGGPPPWALCWPALLRSLHLPPSRRAQSLAFLTHPNPALLSQAKTTPQTPSWLGASSTPRILGLSLRDTVFPILPPPLPPIALGFVCSHPPIHCARSLSPCLSLSLSPRAALLSGFVFFLPCPLVCPALPPSPLCMAFLQGSLHLAHLSLPSSLRVSGAALGALAPAPGPSLLSFLLSSWKVQPAGWEGEAGVCCELLLLTWPSMPASPPTPLRAWASGAHLCPSPPLPGLLTLSGTYRGWAPIAWVRSSCCS